MFKHNPSIVGRHNLADDQKSQSMAWLFRTAVVHHIMGRDFKLRQLPVCGSYAVVLDNNMGPAVFLFHTD